MSDCRYVIIFYVLAHSEEYGVCTNTLRIFELQVVRVLNDGFQILYKTRLNVNSFFRIYSFFFTFLSYAFLPQYLRSLTYPETFSVDGCSFQLIG